MSEEKTRQQFESNDRADVRDVLGEMWVVVVVVGDCVVTLTVKRCGAIA